MAKFEMVLPDKEMNEIFIYREKKERNEMM